MAKESFAFRVDPVVGDKLREAAKRQNITTGELMRRAADVMINIERATTAPKKPEEGVNVAMARLTPDRSDQLTRYAESQGMQRAEVVTVAVHEYLDATPERSQNLPTYHDLVDRYAKAQGWPEARWDRRKANILITRLLAKRVRTGNQVLMMAKSHESWSSLLAKLEEISD